MNVGPAAALTPLYSANAKYLDGVGFGYAPTATGSGLSLSLTAGTAFCGNPPAAVTYTGGSLTLTNGTNYVYLDPTNACAPASNTSGFSTGQIPIATVVASGGNITTITDLRHAQSPLPCAVSSAGSVNCAALGTNQNVSLTPSGTGSTLLNGKVGVGTASPQLQLDVAGAMRSGVNLVTFSPTPTFDASLGNTQKITLTGNVTSSTLANAQAGQIIYFTVLQDGSGSRAFVWPAKLINPPAVSQTANAETDWACKFDGTNCQPLTSGSGGSGTVTTTGSPASGNLTKFSSATSITNADLSGDVTTNGTLSTTVTKVNGQTPGGTCANQAVTALSSSAVPTCATLTSSYVDTSIAKTGTDINTSNQVTATHLASGLPIAQGGTGQTSASAAFNALSPLTTEGDLHYYHSSSNTRLAVGTNGQCLTSNGTDPVWGACGGGGSSALSAITAATAANTIGNGDNAQTWQWSLATANKSAFSFGESAASTATGSPFLVNINTLSSSTANPLVVTAGGSANGVKVDTTGKLSAIGTGAINATQCNGGSCGSVTGSGLTSGQLVTGGGSSAIQVGNLSGDVTTSGSTATTVAKVNGVSYPASPSQNTVPIVTGVNTITYMQVPNATLMFSSMTLNGTANQITAPGGIPLGGSGTFAIANPFIFPGKATLAASASGAASLNVPAGTAPSPPSAGDLWNPGSSLVFYDGTANRTLAATGACTNQAVTGTSSTGVSCATITSSYVDTSIAKTGADINTSNQVTATHLASGLPIAQGGTGQTSASAAFNGLSPLTTEGDLLYYHSSANARLGVGTNGQCLVSNGTDPAWSSCSGSAGYSTIQNNGTSVTQRSTLNAAAGLAALDDSTNSRTIVRRPMMSDTTSQLYLREDFTLAGQSVSGAYITAVTHYAVENLSGTGGAVFTAIPPSGYLGVYEIDSGATSGNDSLLQANPSVRADLFPAASSTAETVELAFSLATVANDYHAVGIKIGNGGATYFLGEQGMFCDVTDTSSAGTWACHTIGNSLNKTDVTLSPSQTADTNVHILRIVWTSSTVTFYWDGTQVGTSSTNITTYRLSPAVEAKTNTSGAAATRWYGWSWMR